jgi:hypothetical protein
MYQRLDTEAEKLCRIENQELRGGFPKDSALLILKRESSNTALQEV